MSINFNNKIMTTIVNFKINVTMRKIIVNFILTSNELKVKLNGCDERMTEWLSKFNASEVNTINDEGYCIYPIRSIENFKIILENLNNDVVKLADGAILMALDSAKHSLGDKNEFNKILKSTGYHELLI